LSDDEVNYSKDLVIFINSVAAFITIFVLKFLYGLLYLNLMEPKNDAAWIIGSSFGALVVTAICIGLFFRKEVFRKIAIGFSVFGLFIFPVGTLVSIAFALCLIKNKGYYK